MLAGFSLMPFSLALYFWVPLGSALGGAAGFLCTGVAARLFGETFPWGAVRECARSSFIIGFFATLTGPDGRICAGTTARQFVMTGILGGFTTFSSFSLQTLNLANDGELVPGRRQYHHLACALPPRRLARP
jgi:CrcB protein